MIDMRVFTNQLIATMAAAQTAGAPPMDHDHHDLHDLPWDDSAAAELGAERRERTLSALYSAAMLGLAEEDLRHLCTEAGVTYADLQQYTPPILRVSNQPEDNATASLPF
jgi:hypothetical protein